MRHARLAVMSSDILCLSLLLSACASEQDEERIPQLKKQTKSFQAKLEVRWSSFYRSDELRRRSRRLALRRGPIHSRPLFSTGWRTRSFRPAGSTKPPPIARNHAHGSNYFREKSTTPSRFSKRGFMSS